MSAPASSASPSGTPPSSGNTTTRQTTGSSPANRSGSHHHGAVDLFASLMGLLAATQDMPGDPLATDGTNTLGAATQGDDPLGTDVNPLSQLLSWPGSPLTLPAAPSPDSTGPTVKGKADLSAASDNPLGMPIGIPSDAQVGAQSLGNSQATGVSLQGMTLLEQPVAADAELLAGLKNAAQTTPTADTVAAPVSPEVAIEIKADGAATATSSRHDGSAIARPANWRSTTTMGAASPATTSTTALQNAQGAANPQGARERDLVMPSPRSTTAIDERFQTLQSSTRFNDAKETGSAREGSGLLVGLGEALPHASQTGGNAFGGGQGDAGFGPDTASEINARDPSEQAFSLDAELQDDGELNPGEHLGPHSLRHASVRVGDGTPEALDIRLSLKDDTINVDFRSDNAEVRAGLQHDAANSLSDLMQRSGIQLGGVSVGAQSQQPHGQPGHAPHKPAGLSNGGASPSSAHNASAGISGSTGKAVARRSDGGPALDVFA